VFVWEMCVFLLSFIRKKKFKKKKKLFAFLVGVVHEVGIFSLELVRRGFWGRGGVCSVQYLFFDVRGKWGLFLLRGRGIFGISGGLFGTLSLFIYLFIYFI
jgi:hypothetical protein